jgi:hypothetical protein
MKPELVSRITLKSWKNKILCAVAILVIVLAGFLPFSAPTPAAAATTYIYATFKGDAPADEKLWIYTSPNANSFSLLSNTGFGGSTGVLRDPSIMKHTDGKYYVAYTVQSWTTQSTFFSIASSTNLINWTQIASVNAGVAGTAYTWAPEWYIEGSTIRIIVSLGTSSYQFTPYIFTATNSALTTWSAPVGMGIGANTIDTFVVKSGSTYHAFVKDETTKWVKRATSSSLTSGWSAFTNLWQYYEAPAVAQTDDGVWHLYIDKYTNGGIWQATSTNLTSWSGLTLVGAYRHGTVLKDPNYTGSPTPTPGVYYRITNRNSGKVMDVQNPNTSDGAKVGQYTANGGAWQDWQFVDKGSGYFNIVSRHSGKCLDVNGASTADGAQMIQWGCGTGNNQQFQWAATGSYFNIKARHSSKCVNVVSSSTANGALLEQRACGAGNSFQWSR